MGRAEKKRLGEAEKKIAELEKRAIQVHVNVNVGDGVANIDRKPRTAALPRPNSADVQYNVAEHKPDKDIVRIGTTLGPMTVRLNHKKTVEDVLQILSKHNILTSLGRDYE